MQSDLTLCNKHFDKNLIEVFKALKCFEYKQPQKLNFFRKTNRTLKVLYINVGQADFNK